MDNCCWVLNIYKGIKPPGNDETVARSLATSKLFIGKKMRIMSDRDIYFSDKRKENFIVVGGTSINTVTTLIN
jgi:hypothetical protein